MRNQMWMKVAAAAVALLVGGSARGDFAETMSDGTLSVVGQTNGKLHTFVLDGISMTYGTAVQFQFVNGSQWNHIPTTWTVDPNGGPTGTYDIYPTDGPFDINVVTTILDPLTVIPGATTRVVEQVLTFTNTSTLAEPLDTVSYIDNQVRETFDDTTGYDAATGAVYAVDPTYPSIMAMIAEGDGATVTWENMLWDDFDSEYDFENVYANTLANNTNTIIGEDTASLMGLDFGMVGAGGSRVATFWYLVADGVTTVPDDFTITPIVIPEPGTMVLVALGGLGLALRPR